MWHAKRSVIDRSCYNCTVTNLTSNCCRRLFQWIHNHCCTQAGGNSTDCSANAAWIWLEPNCYGAVFTRSSSNKSIPWFTISATVHLLMSIFGDQFLWFVFVLAQGVGWRLSTTKLRYPSEAKDETKREQFQAKVGHGRNSKTIVFMWFS